MQLKIAPSILAADFARLGEQVRAVEEAGADMLHLDVMDGHFVPNLTLGPAVVESLRAVTDLPLDVHLMITDPERYLDPFVKAGASHITFHIEANGDPIRMAGSLRERGIGAGITLNPETPVDGILPLLEHFDMVLVMTVHPGFGGQSFLGENLDKARAVRASERSDGAQRAPLDVQVDGGIDVGTAPLAKAAGCNVFVAGSSVFRTPDPGEAVRELRRIVERAASAGEGERDRAGP